MQDTMAPTIDEQEEIKPKRGKAKTPDQLDALTVRKIPGAKTEATADLPMIKITLPLPPEMADDEAVDKIERITWNGYKYEIKLGYAVMIPYPVFEILKHGKYANIKI